MQFTYPELLWALFLLLIPLLIHLFQLRRFKKTPFTNVKLLQRVVAQSRQSRTLRKWLLLITRLLLIAALVLAFAKPYISAPQAVQERHMVIYLDNSFSMQANTGNGRLLENAVQELLQSMPEDEIFSLFTNSGQYEQVRLGDIRDELLELPFTSEQLDLQAISLIAETLLGQAGEQSGSLICISDFQERMDTGNLDSLGALPPYFVRFQAENPVNISIDSAYLSDTAPDRRTLTAILSASESTEATPVSLYNGDTLIAKTAATWMDGTSAEVTFTLPESPGIEGKISISDAQLSYDNNLYFTIDRAKKVNVLSIGNPGVDFLGRIFTTDEFVYRASGLEDLNYSDIPSQNLLLLNELETIPPPLSTAVREFKEDGGSVVLIPAANADIASYQGLMQDLGLGRYGRLIENPQDITGIVFSHPLYRYVFEDRVTNFQYPEARTTFTLTSNRPAVLTLQGGQPFLVGNEGAYAFAGPLSGDHSNFRNSPLIVPTFYNMGINSLKVARLYYVLGKQEQVDIPVSLEQDRIFKITQGEYEFIPAQQAYASRTSLFFSGNPDRDGNFMITQNEETVQRISFNYDRKESKLRYIQPERLPYGSPADSLSGLLRDFENEGQITFLWKWFVILALVCLLAELLIQKLVT